MKTKFAIVLVAVSVLFSLNAQAQNSDVMPNSLAVNSSSYNLAIGLRAGETSGLTFKKFVGGGKAVEGIFGFWRNGLSATVLFERHTQAFDVSGLNWYYGAGGHALFRTSHHHTYHKGDRYYHYHNRHFGLGIDGVFGMEYKIPKAPIAVSLDLKPFIETNLYGGVWTAIDPGLGLKVTF